MNTILIDVEEAAKDLHAIASGLRSSRTRAFLMCGDRVLAELSPYPRPDEDDYVEPPPAPPPEGWQRVVESPVTGLPVVMAKPGERKITSEEIYEFLRGS
jgi:hypothetical protein